MDVTAHDTAALDDAPSPDRTGRLARGVPFGLGITVVAVALSLALSTYLILTGQTRLAPTDDIVIGLLVGNATLVAAMVAMILWQLATVWIGRRRGSAGARLHVRLISMFALVAVLPAVLVAVFATVTLDRGLDSWFSQRTRAIIDNAQTIAEAYLLEHGQIIRGDAAAMRSDINRAKPIFDQNMTQFAQLLTTHAALRALSAAYVIERDGDVLARVRQRRDGANYAQPPEGAFVQAEADRIVVFSPGADNMVRALVKLPDYADAYLYLYRAVDPKVVDYLRETQANRAEYNALEGRRSDVQLTFALLYVGMTLIFLLAAIWFGIWVANRLVQPIGMLITAARQVSRGDLTVSVDISRREGDLASLGRTFNDMIHRLRSQRDELVEANTQLDSRRLFMEAVLSGVTAGVIGLDRDGRVELANPSALGLLQTDEKTLVGAKLDRAVPEFAPFLADAFARPSRLVQGQATLQRSGMERNLQLRVTSEQAGKDGRGYVVTFDDITDLVTAQRSSAWADIARRIAHEIKNPLTPIQLSAERLKRKYGRHIEQDRDIFEQCTDTIIRQVGDIGRMVDEFSSFARMPKANMELHDIHEVVRDAVVLQRVAYPDIKFTVDVPSDPLPAMIDRRLIGQALTNLVKNASEAIAAVIEGGQGATGEIDVSVRSDPDHITITVTDNGRGLPSDDRRRLVEPYVTTREKGTGLGLAIVHKIMEDHGGTLTLQDAPAVSTGGRGAKVQLVLPLRGPDPGTAGAGEPSKLESVGNGV